MSALPVLWSFRRCPYAMRARLAVQSAGLDVELREILLKVKPEAFLATSASGTVPALQDGDLVIDESRDIMVWALERSDPEGWLDMTAEAAALIDTCDGPFKAALDHTKYAVRHPDRDEAEEREKASVFLRGLDRRLETSDWLFDKPRMVDFAVLPFVRQFANTDRTWFDAQEWPHLIAWLDRFLESDDFAAIMTKYSPWEEGQTPVLFGGASG